MAGRDFGGDVRFMDSLVGQHRLTDEVADGEDVRHVGAHLGIDIDEATVGHRDALKFHKPNGTTTPMNQLLALSPSTLIWP